MVVMRTSCVAPTASVAMASPAKQTPEHVFKALRNRRLASAEQADVLRRYLRWRSVNAQIAQIASVHNDKFSALAVAALAMERITLFVMLSRSATASSYLAAAAVFAVMVALAVGVGGTAFYRAWLADRD